MRPRPSGQRLDMLRPRWLTEHALAYYFIEHIYPIDRVGSIG